MKKRKPSAFNVDKVREYRTTNTTFEKTKCTLHFTSSQWVLGLIIFLISTIPFYPNVTDDVPVLLKNIALVALIITPPIAFLDFLCKRSCVIDLENNTVRYSKTFYNRIIQEKVYTNELDKYNLGYSIDYNDSYKSSNYLVYSLKETLQKEKIFKFSDMNSLVTFTKKFNEHYPERKIFEYHWKSVY
jgi:hypothetical protein